MHNAGPIETTTSTGSRGAAREPVGVVAGAGELPKLVARNVRLAGRRVSVIALRGSADPGLRDLCDRFRWAGVARPGGWIRALRADGCREVVMVGRVRKAKLFALPRWLQWLLYVPDLTAIRVWYRRTRDKRNDSVLSAVADEFERKGLTLMDSTHYIPEALASEGCLGRARPAAVVEADIAFAWPLAKQIAGLDIGQAVTVKEQEIIAVEAIEGTDLLIDRTASLCPVGGWTLVKVAKPRQDMRFDVPTIGPITIEKLRGARAAALVVEAGKTIILERDRTLALADAARLPVIGRRDAAASDHG